ncbi:unnamed protein product [Eretmochelys imbricata]
MTPDDLSSKAEAQMSQGSARWREELWLGVTSGLVFHQESGAWFPQGPFEKTSGNGRCRSCCKPCASPSSGSWPCRTACALHGHQPTFNHWRSGRNFSWGHVSPSLPLQSSYTFL